MAGFFKRMFKFGKQPGQDTSGHQGHEEEGRHEEERVPGSTSDVEVSVTGAPDADLHREAKATPLADEEAGADVRDDSDEIRTIKDVPPPPANPDEGAAAERAKREAEARRQGGDATGTAAAESDGAQKKNRVAEPDSRPGSVTASSAPPGASPGNDGAFAGAVGDALPPAVEAAKERAEAPSLSIPAPAAGMPRSGWFQRMRTGLKRSSDNLTGSVTALFTQRKLDDETLQDLEDVLIRADLGIETATAITDKLAATRMGRDVSEAEVRGVMADEIERTLAPVAAELELDLDHQPHVMLMVGVNGSGKTTTIGKLSKKLYDAGFSTLLVAGDTFRAAAIEQLQIWGERTHSPVIAGRQGSDPAGLAYDAWRQAKEEGRDVMLMDTAGRLQNKAELMDELAKIVRVLRKQDPTAPHTVLLTLDATTGQNALNQVEVFKDVAGVNGLVMTKLDGTARGGILVAIAARHRLPVYFIGVGEGVQDLEPFDAKDFARAIVGAEKEAA